MTEASSLWHHRDFRLLWTGQAVSEVGSQVTMVALPLLAVLTLHATAFEVALLSAVSSAAFLLVALQAGAWLDRRRKQPVLVRSDWARAALIATLPVAHLLGVLTLAQLYVVALLSSVLTVFFDVAYQSYLPLLVSKGQLVEGNSKLSATAAVAQFSGPALGGVLVGAVGAPYAMGVDAASFLVSGAATRLVRDDEPQPEPRPADRRLRDEIGEGLGFVLRHPILSRVVACTGSSNFFSSLFGAVDIVFLVRELGASAAIVGLLFSLGAVGGLAGAFVATPLARRFGSARIIWLSLAVTSPVTLLGPLASPGWGLLLFAAAMGALSLGSVVYNVAQVSYRQAICPPHLLGRMNAAVRFIVWGTMPLGALAGGAIGSLVSVRAALLVGAIGMCLSVSWVLASPLRTMRDLPSS